MQSMLDAALRYAELGYPVFPCKPNGKAPLTEHGLKDASADPAKIDAWWGQYPEANIGLSTQGLVVVDVDPNGKGWPYDEVKAAGLSAAPLSLTPRGRHYFFRQPAGQHWKNSTGKIAKGVDVRADGGYVCAPPSFVNGKSYRWAETLELTDGPESLAEPPGWLSTQTGDKGRDAETATKQTPTDANAIPAGQRNDTLARLAGSMRRVGMSKVEIMPAILQVNQDRCQPPLSAGEVKKIVASICRYEPDQASVAMVEDWASQDAQASASGPPAAKDPGETPVELLRVPGLVSAVMDHTLSVAPYPNVAMAFGGALALQATLAGRKVRDAGDLRTNLYLILLANSGAGKEAPRQVNDRILSKIGMGSCLGGRWASGEGLEDALSVDPCKLFQVDEIDTLFQQITKAKDGRWENLIATLLQFYSSANTQFRMRAKAGLESCGSIDQPCLVVHGTAVPKFFYDSISSRMMTNGLIARSIVIEAGERPAGNPATIRELPGNVLVAAQWWADLRPGDGNLAEWHPVPVIVPNTAKADTLLADVRAELEARYAKAAGNDDPVGMTIWSRAAETIGKLALVFACSENHKNPIVDTPGVWWARAFVTHQIERLLFQADSRISMGPGDAKYLRAVRALRRAKGKRMTRTQLSKATRFTKAELDQVVATLCDRGAIVVEELAKTGGRQAQWYQLCE